MPSNTRQIDISAHGRGCAVLQIKREFNVPLSSIGPTSLESDAKLDLEIHVRAKHLQCTEYTERHLIMCFKFTPGGRHRSKTNMLVVKLNMVTGYWPNPDSLQKTVDHGKIVGIKKYEIIDESVYFYIDGVGLENTCISLLLQPLTNVSDVEPGVIDVYDYYEPRLSARGVYR